MNKFVYTLALVLLAVQSSQAFNSRHREKRQDEDADDQYDDQDEDEAALGLINDAKSIRENIDTESFTCDNKIYGYYADVANDCQIFHICYPITHADGQEEMLQWSFICPNQTIFDQKHLVCSFPLDSLPCDEAPDYYDGPDSINAKFGQKLDSDDSESRSSRDYDY